VKLHVRHLGSGPDLVLIHGWGLAGGIWDPLLEPLATQFRVHCVDLPGYGGSRGSKVGTIQDAADAIIATLPAEAQALTVCGWSLGAHVALAAYARHTARIAHLALVAATPSFVKRIGWPHGVEPAMLDAFSLGLAISPASVLKKFSTLINQGDAEARALTRVVAEIAANPPPRAVLENGLGLLRDLDLRPLLPKIHKPVLLIHGDSDPLMPLEGARWTQNQLPDARLEVFEKTAHAPFLSNPERFVAALAAFAGQKC
jgi:pimeloyl-[acyl-carrier protein] methyl ester esterase